MSQWIFLQWKRFSNLWICDLRCRKKSTSLTKITSNYCWSKTRIHLLRTLQIFVPHSALNMIVIVSSNSVNKLLKTFASVDTCYHEQSLLGTNILNENENEKCKQAKNIATELYTFTSLKTNVWKQSKTCENIETLPLKQSLLNMKTIGTFLSFHVKLI